MPQDAHQTLDFDESCGSSIFDDDYMDDCFSDDSFSIDSEADESSELNVNEEDDMQGNEENKQQKNLLKNSLHQWALKFHISLVALTALLLILKPFLPFHLP